MKKTNIIKDLHLDLFIKDPVAKKSIEKNIKDVLESIKIEPENTANHNKCALACVEAVLTKFDLAPVFRFYRDFAKLEPTLLSLADTRDHLLHMFHVFLFGLRIIGPLAKLLPNNRFESSFHIEDENNDTCAFSRPYSSRERIFYMWTLGSLLHDIGYPLERLFLVHKGLQNYAEHALYDISPLDFHMDHPDILSVYRYIDLMSSLHGGKLAIKDHSYIRHENPFLAKVFSESLRPRRLRGKSGRNHGVLSAIMLLGLIERLFLYQRSKYKISRNDFNKYIQYYFKDDVVRIGLFISLHHLKTSTLGVPRLEKIRFSEFPLAYLLILTDELQEFVRRDFRRKESILAHNLPNVTVISKSTHIEVNISYTHNNEEINKICTELSEKDGKKAIKRFWLPPTNELEKRLYKQTKDIKIKLSVKNKKGKNLFEWQY